MRNIKLTIEYNGTNYQGWQRQKNTHQTLQEIVEKTAKQILQKEIRLIAAGRTDAGVHAWGQVANFRTTTKIPVNKLKQALNSLLPDDIVITRLEDVDLGFHARFNARSKTYRYVILNQRHPSALWYKLAYFFPYKLDFRLMHKAARLLLGRHNFACFQAADKGRRNNIRTIKKIQLSKNGKFILIDVEADGFLYKMVRNIVGTLIMIANKKQPPISIQKILTLRNRKFAGPTVVAHGLYLLRVKY